MASDIAPIGAKSVLSPYFMVANFAAATYHSGQNVGKGTENPRSGGTLLELVTLFK